MSKHKSSCSVNCRSCRRNATHIRKTFKTPIAKRDEIVRRAIKFDMGILALIRMVEAWFQDFADLRAEFGTENALYQSVYPKVWER